MRFVFLIIGLSIATYIPRMLPALFMDKIRISKKMRMFLQLIPYTAMAALIFPGILSVDDHVFVGLFAGFVAIAASLKNMPVIGVVLLSTLACLFLYAYAFS